METYQFNYSLRLKCSPLMSLTNKISRKINALPIQRKKITITTKQLNDKSKKVFFHIERYKRLHQALLCILDKIYHFQYTSSDDIQMDLQRAIRIARLGKFKLTIEQVLQHTMQRNDPSIEISDNTTILPSIPNIQEYSSNSFQLKSSNIWQCNIMLRNINIPFITSHHTSKDQLLVEYEKKRREWNLTKQGFSSFYKLGNTIAKQQIQVDYQIRTSAMQFIDRLTSKSTHLNGKCLHKPE